jgi:hypothetical protein
MRKIGEGGKGKGERKKAWRSDERDASDCVKLEQKHSWRARFDLWNSWRGFGLGKSKRTRDIK